MIRGELAVAVIVLLTIVMLVDVARGNSESFGQWGAIIGVSVVLTLINSAVSNARKAKK